MGNKQPVIKILAFGNSLTAGYIKFQDDHPYTLQLSDLITANFPDHLIQIVVKGVPGENTQDMIPRLASILAKDPYDLVLLLGGTNDMGVFDHVQIYENLERMYEMAKDHGAVLVVMSIADHFCTIDWYLEKRAQLNQMIMYELL
eukprot:TRINITY_DN1592_c0_g1_i2.p1 TRINITY_DN1592_c0_g1~~TRINITY_DN1592_c0_g1_i2.p1  ORF type:complete len:145 (+),score=30.10 TRINITY_DN1592_c0_g1_i2:58-492(+)